MGRLRLRRPVPAAALDLRALRALPFATVCVVVSGLGHSLGGGGTVPLRTLLVGGLVVWVAATALAGRERSLRSIVGGLAAAQLGLHLYFHEAMSSSMAAMNGMSGMAGMPGMAAAGSGAGASGQSSALLALALRLICGPAAAVGSASLPPGTTAGEIVSRAGIDPHLVIGYTPHAADFWTHSVLLGLSPLMLLGHLAAAGVIGWWLQRGEAALWQLVRTRAVPLDTVLALATALMTGGLPATAGSGLRLRAADDGAPRRLPRSALLRHQVVRRGPPAALLTA